MAAVNESAKSRLTCSEKVVYGTTTSGSVHVEFPFPDKNYLDVTCSFKNAAASRSFALTCCRRCRNDHFSVDEKELSMLRMMSYCLGGNCARPYK